MTALAMMCLAATLVSFASGATQYPTVTAHGMGDSCFNPGMKDITKIIGQETGQYSVCVPTGDNLVSDTANGFFMTMNKNVDVFAEKIRKDANLANGFNCVGFSQGNLLCRGYIQKYNDPPVITFLSVHGPMLGVAGFPHCNPEGLLGPVCKTISNISGSLAYGSLQDDIFQVDYFRDPMMLSSEQYKQHSELALWNNEGDTVDPTIKANFAKTKRFAMIKALKDTMIFPNDSEWWGYFSEDSLKSKVAMNETRVYKEDLFGLRTADEAGKIVFNSTAGNHLQFSNDELIWWVNNYFVE